MFKTVFFSIFLVIGTIYLIYFSSETETVAQYFEKPSSPSDISFEEQLIAGADPTEVLDATASTGKPSQQVNCDSVTFGKSSKYTFVKELGGNLYVADVNGLKAFKQKSSYVATQVPFDYRTEQLKQAFNHCKQPSMLYTAGISFVTSG